jgi:hypothetical protein
MKRKRRPSLTELTIQEKTELAKRRIKQQEALVEEARVTHLAGQAALDAMIADLKATQ